MAEKINHKRIEAHGVKFDSMLELDVYNLLTKLNVNFTYQPTSFIYSSRVYPEIKFITKRKKLKRNYKGVTPITKHLMTDMRCITDCVYTPDFFIDINGYRIILECKGFPTEVFKLRYNLWRKFMDNVCDASSEGLIIAELYSVKEVEELIKYVEVL